MLTAEQRSVNAPLAAADSLERLSFIFPESTYVPGLGWEIDSGGPAVRMELFIED